MKRSRPHHAAGYTIAGKAPRRRRYGLVFLLLAIAVAIVDELTPAGPVETPATMRSYSEWAR